ncbi:MAG: integrase family protein [Propionivibrio sp.]|uniref:Integrase family protein n=1 Tax=Candidatus Propionivibrio dominans TaxID=2954373 RepID=A0A9D7I8X8_9RHOO|nr:integrase family protein [Candidatus Propionivibrio dominans]
MAKVKFTAGRVAGFKCEPGKNQSFLWCDTVPGLAVRATGNGAKAYIFQRKVAGQTMRVTIGSVQAWGIDAAQEEARTLQKQIDHDDDPRQVKAEKLAATEAKREDARNAEAPAMEAGTIYIATRQAKWSASHRKDHATVSQTGGEIRTRGRRKGEAGITQPGALVPLLALPLAKIDADQVRAWLRDEALTRPTHARLAFGLLRAFLNWCADRPEYRANVHVNACASRLTRDELPKKAAKDDCLQREQLPLWFEHVRKLANPVHSAYLQTLLLTGARREELAGLKWADVDFQWNSLTIKDKVEGSRTIPLTPFVASLLAALPRRTMERNGETVSNPWVFSSPTAASGRLMEPRIGHNKALTAAGLPALTLHGLRRSFGTLSEWCEVPAGVVAQLMGHKPSATAEKHYRRRPLDLLRQWHVKIEAWILEQAGIDFVPEKAGLLLVKNTAA